MRTLADRDQSTDSALIKQLLEVVLRASVLSHFQGSTRWTRSTETRACVFD
jgi:hypothetical protein